MKSITNPSISRFVRARFRPAAFCCSIRTWRHRCASTEAGASSFDDFAEYILTTQNSILAASEELDGSGKKFIRDKWERDTGNPNAGYGITCVLEGGNVLEKAAVNVTMVSGVLSATRAQSMSSR